MDTFFASPYRSTPEELASDLELIADNPVINGLMNFVSGLFAVLNHNRQVLILNKYFFEMMGVDDSGGIFGLRVGEAVNCIHAFDMPAGCGTSRFCSSCGAAISMVTALEGRNSDEKTCAIDILKKDKIINLHFSVRSCPVDLENRRFILVFFQDISRDQQLYNLKQVFFHDINNILSGLIGRCEILLYNDSPAKKSDIEKIYGCSMRIASEIAIQRNLFAVDSYVPKPVYEEVSVVLIFDDLAGIFRNHPASEARILEFMPVEEDLVFISDRSLIVRILGNMITNAFEATGKGETVRVFCRHEEKKIIFSVWNREPVPNNIAKRIFQRNFSTKKGLERGLGTYSMKFFGESILKGKVDFSTSGEEGTAFSLYLDIQ